VELRFLTDTTLERDVKVGITGLLSNITTRPGSHKGGWARLLKCQLMNIAPTWNVKVLDNKDKLDQFDYIIFDLGAEYSGAINLFGGLDEKVYERLRQISEYKGRFFSWRNKLPDVTILDSRRTNVSTCEAFKSSNPSFLVRIQQRLSETTVFRHAYPTSKLLIGDSHTPSVWDPSWMIERQDGRTLYGALENSLISQLVESYNPKEVMIHMSSIDVRHHLARQSEPEQSTVHLVTGLVNQITPLYSFYNVEKCTVVQTMGIEDESRELPKTGYYRGTPFFGSWETRNKIRNIFNEMLKECKFITGWDVLEFPEYFFDDSGKLRFEVMEVPGSVHLNPEHYRWDLDKNKLCWTEFNNIDKQTQYSALDLMIKIERDMYES
jgi:hypothetical protein